MQHFFHNEVMTHINWDVIISSSLRLLLKRWIWYRHQNRTLITMMENTYFSIKKYISKHRAKRRMFCKYYCKKRRIPNLFDKNCTQENASNAIFKHEESWLGWIVIQQVNYKWHYFLLIFPERNCARTHLKPLSKK